MTAENTRMVKAIVDMVMARKDVSVDESEAEFIATVVVGYVCSPPDVRKSLAPKLCDVAIAAMEAMKAGGGKVEN
jgi:hypothetical protein